MVQTQIIKNYTDRPNSFEFGKASKRFKLYFDSVKDLENQINGLKKSGLIKDGEMEEL
jgi:hypothetical protein